MSRLPIQGEYPSDWPEIADRAREAAGHRCIRCGHPYRTGQHGDGELSPCDGQCTHGGPTFVIYNGTGQRLKQDDDETHITRLHIKAHPEAPICQVAQWRILTIHHMTGLKSECAWWNLLALCQRCHLTIQGKLNPEITYFLEHSDWIKPYVAGFYAKKYEGRLITREEAERRLEELLAYERIA